MWANREISFFKAFLHCILTLLFKAASKVKRVIKTSFDFFKKKKVKNSMHDLL